jgi:hypothetical protein
MAVRKKTIQAQFAEAMTGVLEPGEQVVVGVMSQTGPSPWLAGAVGILIMLLLGARWYYVVVTDRRVIAMKASMWTGRPKGGLAWADPLGSVRLADVVTDAKVWQSFKLGRPGASELVRFNVSNVIWKDEYARLVSALQAGSVPPPPAP